MLKYNQPEYVCAGGDEKMMGYGNWGGYNMMNSGFGILATIFLAGYFNRLNTFGDLALETNSEKIISKKKGGDYYEER